MCIEVQAQHIHAAGVFTSKDYSCSVLTVLTAVCIRREGDAIKIQATDNFRLISIESRTEEDGPDETILIPYKAAKFAIPKKGPVTLCLNHQTLMLSITSCNGSSTTIKAIQGHYPDVEQLFKLPGKGTIDGTAQFGINAKLVADAGKACALALGSKGQELRLTCTGELKPILFTNLRPDDTARVRGLIMPHSVSRKGEGPET